MLWGRPELKEPEHTCGSREKVRREFMPEQWRSRVMLARGRYVLPGSFGSLDFLLFRAQRHAPFYLLNKIHTLED